MHELVGSLRFKFSNKILDELSDAAELRIGNKRFAFTTDSYVVKPIFFPGGDIGKLSVFGTVNDLSMKGARPLYISLSFIIEEGFALSQFYKIADSIRQAANAAKVLVVTGDIKVVEKCACDKLFINTSGIGVITHKDIYISSKAKINDSIIINGPIAEHGMAILNARDKLGFQSGIKSDCRNLNFEVQSCLLATKKISVLRDPTRGGLATTLNEIARTSNLGIEIYEKEIPITLSVRRLCDILGFDPLYVPNEGKFVCFVDEKEASKVKKASSGKARVIGRVTKAHKGEVYLRTQLGTGRIIPMLEVDQLPRIC